MADSRGLSRRRFAAECGAAVALGAWTTSVLSQDAQQSDGPCQAMGTRATEMGPHSAVIWTRLTRHAQRNNDGLLIPGRANGRKGKLPEVTVPVNELEGACPGAVGEVRIRYGLQPDLSDALVTAWVPVTEATDFIHQFSLQDLKPGCRYKYVSEVRAGANASVHQHSGHFETAPEPEASVDVRFCVMTCQGYPDRGHPDGHDIYPSMQALQPRFGVLTGDLVYYDNDLPRAVTPELARYHWQRMFSLPRLVDFNSNVGTYWLKDDHDTLNDDSWPGREMGAFTFAEGQEIFRQQSCIQGPQAYRTVRWGRHLQLWMTDGRDHRSPNRMVDGPDKTIWGQEQKDWFKRTVSESDATWKILVSPTPLVGPDRKGKNDNHANAGFQHEGDEIRHWIQEHVPERFFVICGDRHWQFHSIHPETGLHEFSVGAASNEHAGGTPGEDPRYHQFHRVKGGFLSVDVKSTEDQSSIALVLRDVQGQPVYTFEKSARVNS
ncbi:MAG: alkaline phosphatase D family protein [Planctomycetaceae bacterium]|nr:alkaline phosphatase D family protein [Planctomycetaceae bacterium]